MTTRVAWALSTVHGQACEAGCVGEAVPFQAWRAAHERCRVVRSEHQSFDAVHVGETVQDDRVLILVACRKHREVYVLDEWSRTNP